jgi:hypothetical protein
MPPVSPQNAPSDPVKGARIALRVILGITAAISALKFINFAAFSSAYSEQLDWDRTIVKVAAGLSLVFALVCLVIWDAIGKRKAWGASAAIVLGSLSVLSSIMNFDVIGIVVGVVVVLLAIKVRSVHNA